MEKVRSWCGQPSDRGWLKNKQNGTDQHHCMTFSQCSSCFARSTRVHIDLGVAIWSHMIPVPPWHRASVCDNIVFHKSLDDTHPSYDWPQGRLLFTAGRRLWSPSIDRLHSVLTQPLPDSYSQRGALNTSLCFAPIFTRCNHNWKVGGDHTGWMSISFPFLFPPFLQSSLFVLTTVSQLLFFSPLSQGRPSHRIIRGT